MNDPGMLAFLYMCAALHPPIVFLRLGTAWGSYVERVYYNEVTE